MLSINNSISPASSETFAGVQSVKSGKPSVSTNGSEPELEIHLNTQMLLDGMAVVDANSVDSCPNGSLYRAAEATAKEQAVGLWSAPISQNL